MIKNPAFKKAKKPSKHIPTVLITAGPTREPIDPVRFISNYSTGAMGFYIAKEAIKRKFKVILISGPSNFMPPKGLRKFIRVETALEMKIAVNRYFKKSDIIIMAAAVSDFMPARFSNIKIKKSGSENLLKLELRKTPDILKELGKKKQNKIIVGFALETDNALRNAYEKFKKKNTDILVLNELNKSHIPFGEGVNNYTIIIKGKKPEMLFRKKKLTFSKSLLDKVECMWYTSR